MRRTSQTQEVIDTMYEMYRTGAVAGFETEPAVLNGQILTDCRVLFDLRSENRVVVSSLPDNDKQFRGGLVQVTNARGAVATTLGGKQIERPEFIFLVNRNGEARQITVNESGIARRRVIQSSDFVDMFSFPNLNPIPVSDYDNRKMPEVTPFLSIMGSVALEGDIDLIAIPQQDAYTHCSRYFDRAIYGQTATAVAELEGFVDTKKCSNVSYKVLICELEDTKGLVRVSDFDRDFAVVISSEEPLTFTAHTLDGKPQRIVGNEHVFQVLREGIIPMIRQGGRNIHLMPDAQTTKTVNTLLAQARPAA